MPRARLRASRVEPSSGNTVSLATIDHSDEEWSDSNDQSESLTKATLMPRARFRASREEPSSGNTVSLATIDNHDKYRMGAPGTLLPLPLDNSPTMIEDSLTRDWAHIRPVVIKLQKRETDLQSMSIVHRHLPNTKPDKMKTLLVTATAGDSSDPWVFFLYEFCILMAVNDVQDFKADIVDPRALFGKVIYPISLGDEIIPMRLRIH